MFGKVKADTDAIYRALSDQQLGLLFDELHGDVIRYPALYSYRRKEAEALAKEILRRQAITTGVENGGVQVDG